MTNRFELTIRACKGRGVVTLETPVSVSESTERDHVTLRIREWGGGEDNGKTAEVDISLVELARAVTKAVVFMELENDRETVHP